MPKTLAVLSLAAAATLAAGAVHADTRAYTVTGFDKVAARNHVRVIVRQGPYSVTVSEPRGRFDDVRLEVRNGTLTATRRDRNYWMWWGFNDRPEYTVTVTAPSVVELSAADHGKIIQADVSSPALAIRVSDHGKINGRFSVGRLTVHANDHGDANYAGRCTDLIVEAYDHGNAIGRDMLCETARATAAGHGDVVVGAQKMLHCDAYDHGDIHAFGPASMTVGRISDHGSVRRL